MPVSIQIIDKTWVNSWVTLITNMVMFSTQQPHQHVVNVARQNKVC